MSLPLNPAPSASTRIARPVTAPSLPDLDRLFTEGAATASVAPSEEARFRAEREATDLYLSGHPLRFHADLLETIGVQPISSLPPVPGVRVRVAGLLTQWRRVRTRAGKPMAFATLEDEDGEVEVTLFPAALARSAKVGLGSDGGEEPVVATGVVEVEEGVARLLADFLEPLAHVRERLRVERVLEIRLEKAFRETARLRAICEAYRGATPVRFHGPGPAPAIADLRVDLSPALLVALTDLVGAASVRVRESEGSPGSGGGARGLAWIGRVIPASHYLQRRREKTDEG